MEFSFEQLVVKVKVDKGRARGKMMIGGHRIINTAPSEGPSRGGCCETIGPVRGASRAIAG